MLQAQLRSSESDISKLKSVIKVASDAVRKAAEEKAYSLFAIFFCYFFLLSFLFFATCPLVPSINHFEKAQWIMRSVFSAEPRVLTASRLYGNFN